MSFEQYQPIAVIVVMVINIAAFAFLSFYGTVRLRGILHSSPETERQKQEAKRQAEEIINRARDEAHQIIRSTQKDVSEMLEDLSALNSEIRHNITDSYKEFLHTESERVGQLYRGFAQEFRQSLEETAKLGSKNAEAVMQEATRRMEESSVKFESFLKEEAKRYRTAIDNGINEHYASLQEEAENHKKEITKRIEENINHIISEISRKVLGKSLNAEDHEELIMSALEEAKKEGFFA